MQDEEEGDTAVNILLGLTTGTEITDFGLIYSTFTSSYLDLSDFVSYYLTLLSLAYLILLFSYC